MKKSYLALVEGCVPFEECTIDLPIGRHPELRSVVMSAGPEAVRPRPAATKVRVLERRREITLVECRLHSGRNHQIRVHMAQIGHPVLGDEFYGPCGEIRSVPQKDGRRAAVPRHALHAAGLGFRHPILGSWLGFRSSPPEDFAG